MTAHYCLSANVPDTSLGIRLCLPWCTCGSTWHIFNAPGRRCPKRESLLHVSPVSWSSELLHPSKRWRYHQRLLDHSTTSRSRAGFVPCLCTDPGGSLLQPLGKGAANKGEFTPLAPPADGSAAPPVNDDVRQWRWWQHARRGDGRSLPTQAPRFHPRG